MKKYYARLQVGPVLGRAKQIGVVIFAGGFHFGTAPSRHSVLSTVNTLMWFYLLCKVPVEDTVARDCMTCLRTCHATTAVENTMALEIA